MDQQTTDPNNSPPVDNQPTVPTASMWGNDQSGLPVTSSSPPPAPQVPPVVPTSVPLVSEPVVSVTSSEPVPTFVPPVAPLPPEPAPTPEPAIPSSTQDMSSVPSWVASPATPTESMPTDLSHLIGNSPTVSETVQPQPISVVPTATPETSQVATGGSRGFPKIFLILGGLIFLLAVGGASAYFILGVGNSSNLPTSVPAEEQTLTTPPKQIVPSVAPVETETGTGSATLGNPSGATLSATPIPATPSGTSAINVLRYSLVSK